MISQLQLSTLLEAITRQAPQARRLTSLTIHQVPPRPLGGGHLGNQVPPHLPPNAPPPVLSLGATCRLVSALPELHHLELPGALEGGLSGVERLLRSALVRGRLETLILGDLGKERTTLWLSLDGGEAEGREEEAGGNGSGGPLDGVCAAGIPLLLAASSEAAACRVTLSRCDLARVVTLLGGSDGAALHCLARLGLHLTLQPDPQMTHFFYVKDVEPQADGAATAAGVGGVGAGAAAVMGAGAAAPVAAAAMGAGVGGARGQLQLENDGGGGAVLLDRLAHIRQGGGGLVSLLPADTVSVGFPAPIAYAAARGAGKATAEVLEALGAAGLRCRRMLLDVEGHAKYDGLFMHDAAEAATTHLAPLVLGTCWGHLSIEYAIKSLVAVLRGRERSEPGCAWHALFGSTREQSPHAGLSRTRAVLELQQQTAQELRSEQLLLNAMVERFLASGAAVGLPPQPALPTAAAAAAAASPAATAGVAGSSNAASLSPPPIQGPTGSSVSTGGVPLKPIMRLPLKCILGSGASAAGSSSGGGDPLLGSGVTAAGSSSGGGDPLLGSGASAAGSSSGGGDPLLGSGAAAGSSSGGGHPLPPLTRLEVRVDAYEMSTLGSQVRVPYASHMLICTNRVSGVIDLVKKARSTYVTGCTYKWPGYTDQYLHSPFMAL